MSGRAARTQAQAKVNLALRVLDRQADGFHSIETVFLRLGLGDEIELRATAGRRSLKCYEMRDWPPEGNLAYRAAALYADETGWPSGFEIEIVKNIPIGGGLGGGSADAAAVLRMLNALANNPVSPDDLVGFAGQLGSDVPFLASEHVMALARGRGDKLTQLNPLPVTDVVLFFPPFGIDTGQAYGLLDDARGDPWQAVDATLSAEMFADWQSVAGNSVNDFERIIRPLWPEIDSLLEHGERYGMFFRMSGTGSTVFQVSGVDTRRMESGIEIPPLVVPPGVTELTTHTATSVVPIEILD